MRFDTIIVGGGIAGLYSAYKLCQNGQRVAIIEKKSYWGGRVLSQHVDKNTVYEIGAGRIANIHHKFLNLLEELGLKHQLISINNTKYPVLRGCHWDNKEKGLETYFINNNEKLDSKFLINKVLESSKKLSNQHLQSMSFFNLAQLTLSHDACQFLYDSFGYISELIELNAYDGVRMFNGDFNSDNQYFVLGGGQSQVTDILALEIERMGGKMFLRTNCSGYKFKNGKYHVELQSILGKKYIECENLILAMTKKTLMKMKHLSPIYPKLNSVIGHALMRIYAIYPLDPQSGKVWFHDLPKITTDNPIQYIIPINYDRGLIMISYSDNYMADFWQSSVLLDRLEKDLSGYLTQLFPDRNIPEPVYLKAHYWEDGAHFYRPGYNSDRLYSQILHPFPDQKLYIVGETYSKRQAWVEGSLETAEDAIELILNNQEGGNDLITGGKKLPTFSLEDVSKHNTTDDAWIVIDGYVLDVTNWIDSHPGGKSILRGLGKDYTDEWYSISYHDMDIALKFFPKYVIGILE